MTVTESPRNAWRQATPGAAGWRRSARPDDPDKLYLASADCHAQEPSTYLAEHIERQYLDRIPRLERHDDGSEWIILSTTSVDESPSNGKRPLTISYITTPKENTSER